MKNLNLNDYFDNLGVDEINGLIARMNEMRSAVYSLSEQYETESDNGENIGTEGFATIEEDMLSQLVNDVESYAKKLGCAPLFDIDTTSHLTKEDYKLIIRKYNFLMSEK